MFHWTIATGGSAFSTQLMVAGSPRASNLVPYPGGADSSSAMIIISVNKEDHVWIQLYGSSEHVYGGSTNIGSNSQSTFSGILLQASQTVLLLAWQQLECIIDIFLLVIRNTYFTKRIQQCIFLFSKVFVLAQQIQDLHLIYLILELTTYTWLGCANVVYFINLQ